jgi:hypothetical protein
MAITHTPTPASYQPETSSQEVLAGLVERVTFHNSDNGFCVLRAKARGHRDLITVVGHAAIISAGEWITASGEWVNDHTRCANLRGESRLTVSSASRPRRRASLTVRLSKLMRRFGWTNIRARGLNPGSYRDRVRGYAREVPGHPATVRSPNDF